MMPEPYCGCIDADLILEINPTFKMLRKPEIYQFAISAFMLPRRQPL
jgi:hypothetical protein